MGSRHCGVKSGTNQASGHTLYSFKQGETTHNTLLCQDTSWITTWGFEDEPVHIYGDFISTVSGDVLEYSLKMSMAEGTEQTWPVI